jgi:hypothetical protein
MYVQGNGSDDDDDDDDDEELLSELELAAYLRFVLARLRSLAISLLWVR